MPGTAPGEWCEDLVGLLVVLNEEVFDFVDERYGQVMQLLHALVPRGFCLQPPGGGHSAQSFRRVPSALLQ